MTSRGGMTYWLHRLTQVAVHSDTQGVEFFFCVLKLSWGIFILLPIVSLGRGLAVFGYLVPEMAVGWWFALIGAIQLVGLLRLSLPIRTLATLIALPTWLLLTASIWAASPRSVLWVLMAVLSATNIWLYLRLRRRAP